MGSSEQLSWLHINASPQLTLPPKATVPGTANSHVEFMQATCKQGDERGHISVKSISKSLECALRVSEPAMCQKLHRRFHIAEEHPQSACTLAQLHFLEACDSLEILLGISCNLPRVVRVPQLKVSRT